MDTDVIIFEGRRGMCAAVFVAGVVNELRRRFEVNDRRALTSRVIENLGDRLDVDAFDQRIEQFVRRRDEAVRARLLDIIACAQADGVPVEELALVALPAPATPIENGPDVPFELPEREFAVVRK